MIGLSSASRIGLLPWDEGRYLGAGPRSRNPDIASAAWLVDGAAGGHLPRMTTKDIDWAAASDDLNTHGCAVLPGLLDPAACEAIVVTTT